MTLSEILHCGPKWAFCVWCSPRGQFRLVALLWLLFTLVAPRSLSAQVAGGSITGTVMGASGAPLPGTQISITNLATGDTARTVASDAQGFYIAPDLAPGSYEMRVSSPGFVTQVWTSIGIAAGSVRVLNLTMLAGNAETIVEEPTHIVSPWRG